MMPLKRTFNTALLSTVIFNPFAPPKGQHGGSSYIKLQQETPRKAIYVAGAILAGAGLFYFISNCLDRPSKKNSQDSSKANISVIVKTGDEQTPTSNMLLTYAKSCYTFLEHTSRALINFVTIPASTSEAFTRKNLQKEKKHPLLLLRDRSPEEPKTAQPTQAKSDSGHQVTKPNSSATGKRTILPIYNSPSRYKNSPEKKNLPLKESSPERIERKIRKTYATHPRPFHA